MHDNYFVIVGHIVVFCHYKDRNYFKNKYRTLGEISHDHRRKVISVTVGDNGYRLTIHVPSVLTTRVVSFLMFNVSSMISSFIVRSKPIYSVEKIYKLHVYNLMNHWMHFWIKMLVKRLLH